MDDYDEEKEYARLEAEYDLADEASLAQFNKLAWYFDVKPSDVRELHDEWMALSDDEARIYSNEFDLFAASKLAFEE